MYNTLVEIGNKVNEGIKIEFFHKNENNFHVTFLFRIFSSSIIYLILYRSHKNGSSMMIIMIMCTVKVYEGQIATLIVAEK